MLLATLELFVNDLCKLYAC